MIVLIIIFVLLAILVIPPILSKKMVVEKEITINKPQQEVFNYIKFVRNHRNFSVWEQMDPDMKREEKGTDGQIGFINTWDSSKNKNVGTGEQEIKNIIEGKSIEFELRFTRPVQNIAQAKLYLESLSNMQTKATWGFYGKTKFPMSLMTPVFKGILGKNLQKGLSNLKTELEK